MTPRERVLAALSRQAPDRTPRDFWAEEPVWNRLLAYLGTCDREQALCALGIDVRHLEAPGPPDRELGGGIRQNLWGERYVLRQTPWGAMREDMRGALADARSLDDLESFPWPHPDAIDHGALRGQARAHADHALLYGFADIWQRPALVRGWDEFFVDMIERPEWVHFLCRKFTDYYLEDYTRAAEATRGRIDLYLVISDLGTQRGPLISQALFSRFVAPCLGEMIARIHQLGARVLYHSCGAIGPFIRPLIDLGIDVLDPIQPTGPDMAPERLQADFAPDVCFHGGIDMQRLLPRGSPGEVHAEARRYCETLGRDGGYILAPAHRFQPDVPPENIVAMYR